MHVLINGLSIGSGGGYTVARMLFEFLGRVRPDWRVTMVATRGHKLHEELRALELTPNCEMLWAPPATAGLRGRSKYERGGLIQWCKDNSVSCVLQLNGMVIPGMPLPSFAHFQDPWPYRPEAWTRFKDRLIAYMKRRAHKYALTHCAYAGWTSQYLHDLITGRLGVKPPKTKVLYNGVPDDWIDRSADDLPAWSQRPLRLVTVSNVSHYKRQSLVIDAFAEVVKDPRFAEAHYHIAGQVEPGYRGVLESQIDRLGLKGRVHVEGRVTDERARELFEQSRAYVLMSVCESFGIPAIEAMASGTPVVTSDCCAMPEVCADAAVLVPEDDVERLAESISGVLSDEPQAGRLIEAGLANVRRFRWNTIAENLAGCLQEMVG